MRELEAQAKFLAPVIAAAVAKAVAPLQKLLDEKALEVIQLTKRLDELPEPVAPDLAAIAALVEVPEPIPGKDAEPVDLKALAQAAAALVPVDLKAIADLVQVDLASVAALVEVPEAIPGKDAEPVDLDALAKAAAALIEVPQPEQVDLDALAKAAADLVEVPEPIPGKDAEPVDLDALAKAAAEFVQLPKVDLALLAAEAAALVVMPEPIPGKDAEPVDIEELARSAAALVPVPQAVPAEHGRDALDLEILPAIDETKQYPRGTYAAHRGGLWKSYERTHGLRGWECIVDGIDGVTVTQDSVREFSVTLSKSSGTSAVQKFNLPVPIYKGVWREGDHEPNDVVTWAGSQWTCTEATSEKPGEGTKGWVLSVKRGRDGKTVVETPRDPVGVIKL